MAMSQVSHDGGREAGARSSAHAGDTAAWAQSQARKEILEVIAGTRQWTVACADCLEILPTIPAGSVGAVVTDPPYGMGYVGVSKSRTSISTTGKSHQVPIIGDDAPFDPNPFLRWPCVMTGAHHFYQSLPGGGTFHVWDKRGEFRPTDFTDYDLIWTSFTSKPGRVHRCVWRGICREVEFDQTYVHPTQKPVQVMRWMLGFVETNAVILDPFTGSGTTGVAAIQTGRRFIGIEIDPKYAAIARRRIADAAPLFVPPEPQPEPRLFGAETP